MINSMEMHALRKCQKVAAPTWQYLYDWDISEKLEGNGHEIGITCKTNKLYLYASCIYLDKYIPGVKKI